MSHVGMCDLLVKFVTKKKRNRWVLQSHVFSVLHCAFDSNGAEAKKAW